MKITVSRQELLAALIFASQDDTRYTLCGVQIEAHPNRKPIMVTTDGRRLSVIETGADQPDDSGELAHTMLVRADFVKAVCALSKAVGLKLFPWITFDSKPGSEQMTIELVGCNCTLWSESGALIEGAFPNWRQIVPDHSLMREPVNELGLNAEFMGDFAKAAKLLGKDFPIVQMHMVGPDKAVEVKISQLDGVYGMIMPCKLDADVNYQPEFVRIVESLPQKPTAASAAES
jgi:hypothetical protein